MDPAQTVRQGGIQVILLLEAGGGDVAKMLLADGNETFRASISLVLSMHYFAT